MISPAVTLRIAEAQSKDAGRAIARIDPKEFSKIQADTGDVVGLKSSKAETAAKLMPAYPEMRGRGVVQIDGISRDNLRIGLDEKVRVCKVSYGDAHTIVVTPLDSEADFGEEDSKYLAEILDGTPVLEGNKVRAALFGTKAQDFLVEDTDPKGVVVIRPFTLVKVKGATKYKKGVGVTYEDIGGLEKEICRIREMIELPLKYPELFEKLGIDPPKGVLLHGPPGCGKTLLAKAVATELGVNFISIKGPELLSRYIGESEKGIREVFKKAKMASPCIVFFDEIDSLVPKRGAGADSGVSERVVSQFLAEIDGIEELKGVVVLGATNKLDMVDPAMLRAGRFDFLLEVPKPDEECRYAIFNIHTKDKPLDASVNLKKFAKLTEGLTGADIELICKKASMSAVRENFVRKKTQSDFKITASHFEKILNENKSV